MPADPLALAGRPPESFGVQENLLEMRGVTKAFQGVIAVDGVDFAVRHGEIHALAGENGAGKSTLMHILSGVLKPDEGRLTFAGHESRGFESPAAAQTAGIATVFQERSLFPDVSVSANILAGREPRRSWRRLDHSAMRHQAAGWLEMVGVTVSPEARLDQLSPDEQQLVEVAKALALKPRLVILDEPTAALNAAESARLLAIVERLRGRGVSVIYISHRLDEIFRIADRVTVLKDGRGQATLDVAATTPDELIRLMVGRPVRFQPRSATRATANAGGAQRFWVRGLSDGAADTRGSPSAAAGPGARARAICRRAWASCAGGHVPRVAGARMDLGSGLRLRGISFDVAAGEILGCGGLSGAGRTEMALSLAGLRRRGAGEVRIDGKRVAPNDPVAALKAGVVYLPEDRKADGIFPALSVEDNILASALALRGDARQADKSPLAALCMRLNLRCRDPRQPIAELSGGNQQKCLLARALLLKPKVLIVDEPTRGIDVGAKLEVHSLLAALAADGAAVIVISSDLPELLAISDRILVLRRGEVAGELPGREATEEGLLRLASPGPTPHAA